MTTPSSRAIELHGAFGAQNLRVTPRPIAEPGPGEVLLRMRACSLNYRDLRMIDGVYNPRQPLPLVPLSDGVGEVLSLGSGVRDLKVGDRVMPCFAEGWLEGPPSRAKLATTLGGPLPGVLAEHRITPAAALVRAPAHLSDAEAATLPCAAVTAWHALVTEGQVKPGDRVLVQGTGGVSIFALQFARMLGAEVMITSSSAAKLERARELGASETVDYKKNPEWGKAVRAWSRGEGVDHVVEVGGAGTLDQSLRAVRPGGRISVIGVLSGAVQPINIMPILMQQIRLQGIIVGSRAIFAEMCRGIEAARLHPVVDRVFALDEHQEALEHMRAGRHFGKVVIEL
ncbi:MAG: NAD(P)-dependent alcohol dehydrogenase [Nannocystaceae bacterium]